MPLFCYTDIIVSSWPTGLIYYGHDSYRSLFNRRDWPLTVRDVIPCSTIVIYDPTRKKQLPLLPTYTYIAHPIQLSVGWLGGDNFRHQERSTPTKPKTPSAILGQKSKHTKSQR